MVRSRFFFVVLAACCIVLSTGNRTACVQAVEPIREVEIGANREFRVNGAPFFPIMAWLQDAENFAAVKDCGMNTVAGYWPTSSGTKDVVEYQALVADAGLYGVLPYDAGLRDHPQLLGYIHGDEPDLPHQVSDAEVVPAESLKVNRSTPLWKIVDGVTHSWSVLDPMEGAAITIRLKQPVTIQRLGIWLTVSSGLAVPRSVRFEGDGKLLTSVQLESKKGRQEIPLDSPATFRELRLVVEDTHAGEHVWGSISEIEGFDAGGKNVLLAPPRYEPRAMPQTVQQEYEKIRSQDPSRPVFMTLTGHFHPFFKKWTEEQRRELYPQYIQASDVIGYDIYPIYGWNKPEWLHLVQEATGMLVQQADPRPVYAWIETSKGGQYTGPLERQHDVRPEHIRAEVWMALCRGATAIGYFTHVWKPAYQQFGVPRENRDALRDINAQIKKLAPALLSGAAAIPIQIQASDKARVDFAARQHEGSLYVFAVNYDSEEVETDVSFTILGLADGTEITVIDESRRLRSQDGSFSDRFSPLAVHLYRFPLPGT